MPFAPLYVISVISNPVRFQSRYRLYNEFAKRLESSPNIVHYTVELAHGARDHKITNHEHGRHIQFRSREEVWQKEAMINAALGRLHHSWEYVAWIDADVEFVRPDWALETLHQLQNHEIVQMFESAIDMGPNQELLESHTSLGSLYAKGLPIKQGPNNIYPTGVKFGHPGFAWAARREAIDSVGGLLDMPILGAADHHMAMGLIGKADTTIPAGIHPNYVADVMQWQERASRLIRGNFGYVPGMLLHHWHGSKRNRKYVDRWKILIDNDFDPHRDIHKDSQGLWVLAPHRMQLRDDVKRYFRERNEDSIDL